MYTCILPNIIISMLSRKGENLSEKIVRNVGGYAEVYNWVLCGSFGNVKLPENSQKIDVYIHGKHNVTERKLKFLIVNSQRKLRKTSGKFRENFRNSDNAWKSSPEISRKLPRKFPEKWDVVLIKCGGTERKSILLFL